MQYWINEKDIEPDTSLALYRCVVAWAADHSRYFIMTLQSGIYNHPEDEKRLCALGKVKTIPVSEPTELENQLFQEVITLVSSLGDLVELRVGEKTTKILQVQGIPNEELVRELTLQVAPDKAISGDTCPAEDLEMFIGDRRLYALSDYGRTQVLDVTTGEINSLHQTLRQNELDPSHIVPVPNDVYETQ
ncbi:MAG: hypothetical protein WA865_11865 [Spirulinaceae cyanobacterium]